jgi:hypothetical protein
MYRFVIAVAMLCICASRAADFPAIQDRPVVDARFAEFDALDLSSMPTGDVLARHDIEKIVWQEVKGPDVKRTFRGEQQVVLKDLNLKVRWPEKTSKYGGTLYLFQNCENILIENVHVAYLDPDYRAQHTFLFENCGKIVIRDVYSAGAAERVHIRLEGCQEYLIERTEISGWQYGPDDVRAGAGIMINNGITRDGKVADVVEERRELDWGVIRDCYIHDYRNRDGGKWRNQDGILFHAPANGIVFNCVFERWLAGDGAIDDSHRRHDDAYRNKVHRVERCIFRDCWLAKTNGATGSPDCIIAWMNNLYVDTWMGDYHRGWTNWHLHETYATTKPTPVFVKNWGMYGPTVFANGLIYAPTGLENVYWQSGKAEKDGYRRFRADHLFYLMPKPGKWATGLGTAIVSREDWLKEGLERDCQWLPDTDASLAAPAEGDYRPLRSSPLVGKAAATFLSPKDLGLRVVRDFYGTPRPNPPTPGAFEPPATR